MVCHEFVPPVAPQRSGSCGGLTLPRRRHFQLVERGQPQRFRDDLGRANGDHIEAAARGENFSAILSLTTRGGRQTVTIRPQGTNVTAVSKTYTGARMICALAREGKKVGITANSHKVIRNLLDEVVVVSAIQISCNARLAFGCWLLGNLAITFAVLCTQQERFDFLIMLLKL